LHPELGALDPAPLLIRLQELIASPGLRTRILLGLNQATLLFVQGS